MPVPKRSRRSDEEVEEITEVREASSALRNGDSSRKRVRLSHPAPEEDTLSAKSETEESDSDTDVNDDDVSNGPQSPPQTQYEMMRDNGFRHLEDTERDDQLATQKLAQRQSNVLGDNAVAESGIIESITCYNFMCHERLHVELGPLLNFIVGENGSGKSAVLTGLTLCLGGKASDTNRGGSLKSFIKTNQDHASIVVKIKNAGTDAYSPDIYGESIIVERHFSKTGTSGFKIKSAMGRIISTKKQEVDEICEWYALQIGNPLTVLSQDNARQFLNSASPAQKYKYFVSGVQLEQLDNDYKMSQDHLDRTLVSRDDLNETIERARKTMVDTKRLSDTASKNETLRDKKRLYRSQLAWAQVVEEERELEKRRQDILVRRETVTACEQDCTTMTADLAKIEESLEEVKQTRLGLDEEREQFEEKVNTAEATYNDEKRKQVDVLREERDAHDRLKNAKAAIKASEEKIQQEEQRLGDSTGPERAEKDTALADARSRENDLNQSLETTGHKLLELQDQGRAAFKHFKSQENAKMQKRKEVLSAEQQLQDLQKSSGGAYDGYDADMRRLVDMVSSDSSFQQKPIGPLGAHIRLLKPEWSGILEKTFGEALNAFVVLSKADQSALSRLMHRIGMKRSPPIYIASKANIDTRAHEPDDSFDTVLRVLDFDNELVRAQMIINYNIEKIILVKQRTEAERVMLSDQPPRNVAACLTFHDGQNKRGHGLRITNRGGTTSTSPIQPNNLRPRMQSDTARQLELQKEHSILLGVEMRQVTSDERSAKQALEQCDRESKDMEKNRKNLEQDLRRAQAHVEAISEELDQFEGVDDRLMGLRSTLEKQEEEADQVGGQYGQIALAKREFRAKLEELGKLLEVEKLERSDFQNRINKADKRVSNYESSRRVAIANKNRAFEKLDIEKMNVARAEEKVIDMAKHVRDFIVLATEAAPERVHIPDNETHDTIRVKWDKVKAALAQREKQLGATDEEIHTRALEAKQAYEDVTKKTREVDEIITSLKHTIGHRLHLWRQFQRQISARIRIQFTYLLSERGFRGKIDLNHKAKQVLINVEPDETRKSSAGRNTKTLSGGEKSFSSVCMLLSIWEAMGSPIRCLDEFDVFMDNVNRRISTNMLVEAARRSVSRQYILITPNAIEGNAKVDKDVKIIRLTDPRQRTLI